MLLLPPPNHPRLFQQSEGQMTGHSHVPPEEACDSGCHVAACRCCVPLLHQRLQQPTVEERPVVPRLGPHSTVLSGSLQGRTHSPHANGYKLLLAVTYLPEHPTIKQIAANTPDNQFVLVLFRQWHANRQCKPCRIVVCQWRLTSSSGCHSPPKFQTCCACPSGTHPHAVRQVLLSLSVTPPKKTHTPALHPFVLPLTHPEQVHAVRQVLLCCVGVVPLIQTQTQVATSMKRRLGTLLA